MKKYKQEEYDNPEVPVKVDKIEYVSERMKRGGKKKLKEILTEKQRSEIFREKKVVSYRITQREDRSQPNRSRSIISSILLGTEDCKMIKLKGNPEVAFQGELGAYSESAAYKIFGPEAKPKPCKHFSDVFEEVKTDATDFGVVPIENSIEGSVSQVYDLFLRYDLNVFGETALKISHCFIANKDTEIENVKIVYSHPQALGQCRNYLEAMGFDLVSTYDTAGSVKMIKEQGLKDAASIASERAAEIYGMKILANDIADNPNNYTRFFVLSKTRPPATGNDKTSIIFSTKHIAGALYDALGELATRGINMTKIESRPTRKKPWEYNFYLDFEGHQSEKRCIEAIEGLRDKSVFVRILGSYPKATTNIDTSEDS